VVQHSIMIKEMFELLRSQGASLPPLAKFALGMTLVFGIPPLARRVRLPGVVGLLFGGVVIGPHVFALAFSHRRIRRRALRALGAEVP